MTSIKLKHISASGCHPQGVYRNKGIQVQRANPGTDDDTSEGDQYLHWNAGLLSLCPSRIPEGGTSAQKHVAGCHKLYYMVFILLCFIGYICWLT